MASSGHEIDGNGSSNDSAAAQRPRIDGFLTDFEVRRVRRGDAVVDAPPLIAGAEGRQTAGARSFVMFSAVGSVKGARS